MDRESAKAASRMNASSKLFTSYEESKKTLIAEIKDKKITADVDNFGKPWNNLERVQSACRSVNTQEQRLIDVVAELKTLDNQRDLARSQALISEYKEIIAERTNLDKHAKTVIKEAEETRKRTKEFEDYRTVRGLYNKFVAAEGDLAKVELLDKEIDQVKKNGVSFNKWLNDATRVEKGTSNPELTRKLNEFKKLGELTTAA
jgi:hypothetical protein